MINERGFIILEHNVFEMLSCKWTQEYKKVTKWTHAETEKTPKSCKHLMLTPYDQ